MLMFPPREPGRIPGSYYPGGAGRPQNYSNRGKPWAVEGSSDAANSARNWLSEVLDNACKYLIMNVDLHVDNKTLRLYALYRLTLSLGSIPSYSL